MVSAVQTVEFVSNRMSHIVLRGRWCYIIVLNVYAPSEEKSDDSKGSSYNELEQAFDNFPKCRMETDHLIHSTCSAYTKYNKIISSI